MGLLAKHSWLVFSLFLAGCGGSTSSDGAAAGGSGGAGGASGGSTATGGTSAGCTCAAPLVCDGAECVPALQLMSVTPAGQPGNAASELPDVTADGHALVFVSEAKDLAPQTYGESNVFERYWPGGITSIVSGTGITATLAKSTLPAISQSGEYATLSSSFSFFPKDQNQNFDVLVSDLHTLSLDLISTDASGAVLPGASTESALSEDSGRMVFTTENALVPEDENGIKDVYLLERGAAGPVLLSVPAPDTFPSSGSFAPHIAAHGRFVTFVSSAPDPAGGDDTQSFDVFVRDLDTDMLTRVTPPAAGDGYFLLQNPRISAEGEVVVFASKRSFSPDDGDSATDVYAWSRASGQLSIVSRSATGQKGDDDSQNPSVSADGRFVAFESRATNLVDGDDNGKFDVFVVDTTTHEVVLLSRAQAPANGHSRHARISGDARFVAFDSEASNLVPGDENAASDVFLARNPLSL